MYIHVLVLRNKILSIIENCFSDATHHKLFGSRLAYINEVHKRVVLKLDYIIIFFYQ